MYCKGISMALAGVVLAAALSGCGGPSQEQEQKRQEGITALESGSYSQAITSFDEVLSETKKDAKLSAFEIDTLMYKAAAQYMGGDAAGAKATYDQILASDSENATAFYQRGCILLKDEQKAEQALKDYSRAAKYVGKDYDLALRISEAMSDAGAEDRAQALLKTITKKADDSFCLTKGLAYARLGYAGSAKRELKDLKKQQAEEAKNQAKDDKAAAENTGETIDTASRARYETALLEVEIFLASEDYDKIVKHEIYKDLDSATDAPPHIVKALRRHQIIALERTGGFKEAKKLAKDYVKDNPEDLQMAEEYTKFLETR